MSEQPWRWKQLESSWERGEEENTERWVLCTHVHMCAYVQPGHATERCVHVYMCVHVQPGRAWAGMCVPMLEAKVQRGCLPGLSSTSTERVFTLTRLVGQKMNTLGDRVSSTLG